MATASSTWPIFVLPPESNGVYKIEILERAGHRYGVQIDLDASANLTNWFRPWWIRTVTNSLPADPTNSVRELFTTCMPDTDIAFVRASLHLFDLGPEVANYYVATNGSDSASGTSTNAPFATLAKAVSMASAGNLIYVRGGTYPTSAKISISKIGTAAQPYRVRSYPGEHPILDFSPIGGTSTDGISLSGAYWEFYGLDFVGAPHNAVKIQGGSTAGAGSHNKFELCTFRQCGNTGFNIGSSSSSTYVPSDNLVLNCDAYRNFDPPAGGNADGFAAKWYVGTNNVFVGCRAWENSDDGWDLWMAYTPVVISNCWTFLNGTNVFGPAYTNTFNGNGNGFKLGGSYVPAAHTLVRSIAFQNVGNVGGNGIDQNNNKAGLIIDQNIAWSNRVFNFALNSTPTTAGVHIVRNNVALVGSNSIQGSAIQISNSWQVITSPPVDFSDLLSRETLWANAARRDDGGLPETPFMRPVPGGRLVDMGDRVTTNTSGAFNGVAPDLGAYETPIW
jgi:hypothetical protein